MKHSIQTKDRLKNLWLGSIAIGLASLLWLIIRTGTKPSRAAYPCQRMAAANASAWLGAAIIPMLLKMVIAARKRLEAYSWLVVSTAGLSFAVLLVSVYWSASSTPYGPVADPTLSPAQPADLPDPADHPRSLLPGTQPLAGDCVAAPVAAYQRCAEPPSLCQAWYVMIL